MFFFVALSSLHERGKGMGWGPGDIKILRREKWCPLYRVFQLVAQMRGYFAIWGGPLFEDFHTWTLDPLDHLPNVLEDHPRIY
jgi:hypothetical protein